LGKRGNEVVTAVVERGNRAEEDERDRERQRGEVVGEGPAAVGTGGVAQNE
jgi:hypothetical protein